MKKGIFAKLIAVLMCLAIVFTPLLSVYAQDSQTKYEQDCPYIYVHGFMASTIYCDASDPDSDCAWPPATDKILDAVKEALPSIAKLLIDGNYDKFCDSFLPLANDVLSDVMLGPDGEINNKSGIRWEYPEKESITAQSSVSFRYDWRLDPCEIAEQLDEFIDYVLEASGCDKVVLEAHSLGGVVINTYSKLYGNDKVKTYIFNTTAVYGETYTGELLTGQLRLDPDALLHYLDSVMDYNEKEKLLDGLFKLLKDFGIMDLACKLGNSLLENLFERVATDTAVPLFGGWLTIWAMIPDDKIDAAEDYVFNHVYKNDPTDRSGLKEKIDNYNEKVRKHKTETLEKINEECSLYILTRHGYSSLFLTPSWRLLSDTVIDTKYSSFGATCADFDSVLSQDYLAGKNEKYISPDKKVDASTCLFPDQTWFVRDLLHAEEGVDDIEEMYKVLAYYDGQATVDTFEEYPQFLHYVEETDSIEKDSYVEPVKTFFDKIKDFINKIFAFITGIFSK
ncbi:MAG: hypothetical protein MJ173_06800 [Clostridia bacterium]|nr:hypothetical protein [Clostridia bacterium]